MLPSRCSAPNLVWMMHIFHNGKNKCDLLECFLGGGYVHWMTDSLIWSCSHVPLGVFCLMLMDKHAGVKDVSYKSGTITLRWKHAWCHREEEWGVQKEEWNMRERDGLWVLSQVYLARPVHIFQFISSSNDISKWPLLSDSFFDQTRGGQEFTNGIEDKSMVCAHWKKEKHI